MTPTPPANSKQSPSRVSILARLVPVFSYLIALAGAALSGLMTLSTFHAMKGAENAGIGAVGLGMYEANLPVLIGLYVAIILGVFGIIVIAVRCFMSTTTASPAAWFFVVASGLTFIPLFLLWEAESFLIQGITPGTGGIIQVASTMQLCLTLTLVTAATFALILLVASLVPLPSFFKAKRNYAPLIVLVLMEALLIGMAVAFQVRTSWFYQAGMRGHFYG